MEGLTLYCNSPQTTNRTSQEYVWIKIKGGFKVDIWHGLNKGMELYMARVLIIHIYTDGTFKTSYPFLS